MRFIYRFAMQSRAHLLPTNIDDDGVTMLDISININACSFHLSMQVILQRDNAKTAFDNAKLPVMGGFCFSALKAVAGSSNTFGGPYDPVGSLKQNYTDFYTMVDFEAADQLRAASSSAIPLLVEITQGEHNMLVYMLFLLLTLVSLESGPWNTMQNSSSYTAMKTVFVVLVSSLNDALNDMYTHTYILLVRITNRLIL
jgi:hypothetical protein